jgi:hypothetical protein
MFENLTDRLSQTLRHVTGKAKLTEDNIKDTLREVRMALLEADVALPVVKDFVNKVKEGTGSFGYNAASGEFGLEEPDPGTGVREDRPRRARGADGGGQRGPGAERRAAGGDPDGRPAGRGQDHHRGQAGALP